MTDLVEALQTGDERELLTAMVSTIAETIDAGVAARDLASLSRRLLDLAQELRSLDAAQGEPRRRAVLRSVQQLDERFNPEAH